MKSILICLASLCLLSAGMLVNIYESLDITKDDAKKCLVSSIGYGLLNREGFGELVSKARSLPVEAKVEGIRQLMQLAKEYTASDEFRQDYKKWRNKQLNPEEKGKLGIPRFGRILNKAVDNAMDKKENEKRYPEDADALVKKRLEDFLRISATVDFDAEVESGMFLNEEYQSKSPAWKMCYRAGREVVKAAREEAAKWLDEINSKQQP